MTVRRSIGSLAGATAVAIALASAGNVAGAQSKTPPMTMPKNGGQPTPFPIRTLAPLTGETRPYPAYGTPVPGVNAGTLSPDVGALLTLQQAIAIGFARSPTLASARADVGVAAAAARLAGAGLLPSVAGSASLDYSRGPGGTLGTTTGTGTTLPGFTNPGSGTTPGTGTTPGGGTLPGGGTTPGGGTPPGGTTPGSGTNPGGAPPGSGTNPGTPTGGGGTTPGAGTGTGTTPTSGSQLSPFRGTGTNGSTSAGVGVFLRQLIYDGGRIAASVRAARRNETASADTYRRQLQTVAYNVASSYYSYLSAQRTVQVDLEIVRQDQVQENLVRAQVRAGTEARSLIATVQLPTAQARLAVVRAQGAELAAAANFDNVMGLDANVRVQPVDDAPIYTNTPTSSIAIPPYDEALRRAIALRPDYDSSLQSVASARESLRAARLGRVPTLEGTASAQENSTNGNLGGYRGSQSVGLAFSLPIFDQNITRDNTAQALANVERANAGVQITSLGIALNIKQTLTNFVTAFAALEQTRQEYATAISNVRATQAQYRAGVTTLPLLLNAQVQLSTAQGDQVTAVYGLRQAEQAYLFATGANYDTAAAIGTRRIDPTPVVPRPLPIAPAPPPRN